MCIMIKEGIEFILGIKFRRKSENNYNFSNSEDSASHTLDFFYFPLNFCWRNCFQQENLWNRFNRTCVTLRKEMFYRVSHLSSSFKKERWIMGSWWAFIFEGNEKVSDGRIYLVDGSSKIDMYRHCSTEPTS